ncbi:MAG: hypothetical protein GXY59_04150 [Bacteroidales bacterium]|nr:hypothetical protein [Bacteroidales bacterium]
MDEEFLYNKIREALKHIPGNFNVLEEQIDVQLQMEYFEFARKFRKEEDVKEVSTMGDRLFLEETPSALKREILVALASVPEVEAFRTIERYFKAPDEGMKDWATLAFQESRMLLQSSLLDEQQVFISTGMGGKGQKLRYFVVFLNREGTGLTPMQVKLLRDELRYVLEKNDGELEEFSEMMDFTTAVVILPIHAPLKEIFRGVIDECNQYGNFLHDDMVITNVKRLSIPEIIELLNQQKLAPDGEEDVEEGGEAGYPDEDDPDEEDPDEDDPDEDDLDEDDFDEEDPGEDDLDEDDPDEEDPDEEDPGEDDFDEEDPDEEDPGEDDFDEEDPGEDDPEEEDPGEDDFDEDNSEEDNSDEEDPEE